MKKDNDPRHELAMAIHHISGLILNWTECLEIADEPDGDFTIIAENQLRELGCAKNWLQEAQEKVNK